MKCQLRNATLHIEIPNYAIDLHLPEGRQLGRGHLHYLLEAASLTNEDESLSKEAREWLIELARQKEGEK